MNFRIGKLNNFIDATNTFAITVAMVTVALYYVIATNNLRRGVTVNLVKYYTKAHYFKMDKFHPLLMREEIDMDQMAETELTRLQRQYRIMESNRKAFVDELTSELIKQRREIKRLKQERDNVMEDIQIASCEAQRKKDKKVAKKIEKLLRQHDETGKKVNEEKIRLEELEQQIRKTEKQVFQLRLKDITDIEYRERIKSGKKLIQMLENKLETVIKRFCNVLTQNKTLREEIGHLLKNRTKFNTIWENLLCELNDSKKYLVDLIERATTVYDQREEWCSKLQALKIRAHNDVIMHTQEMREMQRELDHDNGLKEFLSIKGQKRIMKDLEEKEMKRKELEKEEIEQQLKMYQETLDQIKDFCKEEDIDKIASKYLKQEEENFALFNYINEQSHELEALNKAIAEVEEKLEEQKSLSAQNAQLQKDNLETLSSNLMKITEKANEDELNYKQIEQEFVQIMDEIYYIFQLLDCQSTPILGLLGTNEVINKDNIMVYLGLVQKKVSNLILEAYFNEESLLKSKQT